jgi:SAM-dependent methyltransferase
VARALRALSSTYVERRHKLAEGAALGSAGKRAAFALFYAPLHFLLINHIVRRLPGATDDLSTVTDLGCGTGASGAAWAAACDRPPRVVGIDRNSWALGEAAATYRAFGLTSQTRKGEANHFMTAGSPPSRLRSASARLAVARSAEAAGGPEGRLKPAATGHEMRCAGIAAAFTVNELPDASRDAVLPKLLDCGRRGGRVLVVEPIAGGVARWWSGWRREFEQVGGRADEWRFRAELPLIVAKLDRAAGLDHRELTARSLWIGR